MVVPSWNAHASGLPNITIPHPRNNGYRNTYYNQHNNVSTNQQQHRESSPLVLRDSSTVEDVNAYQHQNIVHQYQDHNNNDLRINNINHLPPYPPPYQPHNSQPANNYNNYPYDNNQLQYHNQTQQQQYHPQHVQQHQYQHAQYQQYQQHPPPSQDANALYNYNNNHAASTLHTNQQSVGRGGFELLIDASTIRSPSVMLEDSPQLLLNGGNSTSTRKRRRTSAQLQTDDQYNGDDEEPSIGRNKHLYHDGREYTFLRDIREGAISVYKCSKYKSTQCKAEARIHNGSSPAQTCYYHEHNDECNKRTGYVGNGVCINVSNESIKLANELICNNLSLGATQIADQVLGQLKTNHKRDDGSIPAFCGYNRAGLIDQVNYMRRQHRGSNDIETIEQLPQRNTLDGTLPVLQANCTVPIHDRHGNHELHRIIIYGDPRIMMQLKSDWDWFIDGTFKCTPAGVFRHGQFLIIIGKNPLYNYYVPLLYILMTGRSYDLYHWVFVIVKGLLNGEVGTPDRITTDFEKALLKVLREHFPDSTPNGCLFHLKQAVRRYMENSRNFSSEEITVMMNCLDILCVVPKHDLVVVGLPWVMAQVESVFELDDDALRTWEEFLYGYFLDEWVWLKSSFEAWNLSLPHGGIDEPAGRTTNSNEGYHAWLYKFLFQNSHPNLLTFNDLLRKEIDRQWNVLQDLQSLYRRQVNSSYSLPYKVNDIPTLPDSYKQLAKAVLGSEYGSTKKIGDVGYSFVREFTGTQAGWYIARVSSVLNTARDTRKKNRRVLYSDGDSEDVSLDELNVFKELADKAGMTVQTIDGGKWLV